MALSPGTHIGPYFIVAPIGAGGMGEVYRAHDSKLDRDVALKVLPSAMALDPDRIARFEREAKVLASLNHPHIAQIYGAFEGSPQDGGSTIHALAMELVEGPDLAEVILRSPLPLDEALAIADQVADALEAAHQHGIIHRDLKPANVKRRPDGTVKVLDFGLAKLGEHDASDVSGANTGLALTNSPTMASPAQMTSAGMILGTAAYMSPEQARGRAVDKRADVWAFGCLLYEMLTGRRAFEGNDVVDVLGAVIHKEPALDDLPPGTPATVRMTIVACLQKDPGKRIRDVGDVRMALSGAFAVASTMPPASTTRRSSALALAVVAVVSAAIAGAAVWFAHEPSRRGPT